MPIKLYGLGQSRSLRCLWALCEANIEFDYLPMAFDEGDDINKSTRTAHYLAKNKQGKVPTLENGGFVLTESVAINNYINTLSVQEFIPTDAQARAKYDELCSFVVTELEQPLWTNGKHRFALPEKQRVKEIFPTAEFEFAKAINTLNDLISLEDSGYALEGKFTFADILLAQTIHWAERFEFDVPKNYLNYRDQMFDRDAAKKALDIVS